VSWDVSHEVINYLPVKEWKKILAGGWSIYAKCCMAVLDAMESPVENRLVSSAVATVEPYQYTLRLGELVGSNSGPTSDITNQACLELEQEQKQMHSATKADDAWSPHIFGTLDYFLKSLRKSESKYYNHCERCVCGVGGVKLAAS
jgi:hypothetical protein